MKLLVGFATQISKSFAHALCVHKTAEFFHHWLSASEILALAIAVLLFFTVELVGHKLRKSGHH